MEKLKKPIELKGRVIRYKPVAKLIKNKKMKGENFKIYYYWYGKKYEGNLRQKMIIINKLREKFKGRFTPDEPSPKNFEYRAHAVKVANFANITKNDKGDYFKIGDEGIIIADNFPEFKKIQAEIIKAFEELDIDYEHNPEENVKEINE